MLSAYDMDGGFQIPHNTVDVDKRMTFTIPLSAKKADMCQ